MGGYCYINNAAICAKLLMDNGKTVGIVDVDYHGGKISFLFKGGCCNKKG